ncbi:MAG: hypothetical protein HOW97_10060 [Catenulispora sp.]|nr:hypothetical protein [Catenulispora sp.]
MRTDPRRHILETWRAFARVTTDGGGWNWAGRGRPDSIGDAEQLLCLLGPAAQVPGFALDRPDAVDEDVLAALKPLGTGLDLPLLLLGALEEYLQRYTDELGPTFRSGYEAGPENEVEHELTESYWISVTLCLAAKAFLLGFKETVERRVLRARIDAAVTLAEIRLTAAMVGLLRSFVVEVVEPGSEAEDRLLGRISQGRRVGRALTEDLRDRLEPVRRKLPELTFGLPDEYEQALRDYPERLFQCGWTWGTARDAGVIDVPPADAVPQRPGIAEPRPMLYFTVGALQALTGLFSARTSRLGLLTYDQMALREALNVRWGLAVQYWSTVATFGAGRWAMEDVPWEDADGVSSPYYSVLTVSAVSLALAQGGELAGRHPEDAVERAAGVLEELVRRGLLNRRAVPGDLNIELHLPGLTIELSGWEDDRGRVETLIAVDYAAVLAVTAFGMARHATRRPVRTRLTEAADVAVEHLLARRRNDGLWDDLAKVFATVDEPLPDRPYWDFTNSVLQAFAAAAALIQAPPPTEPALSDQAAAKIAEARHVLDRERLTTPDLGGTQVQRLLREVDQRLNRAEALLTERPATAAALADRALLDLDELVLAVQLATRSR